MENINHFIQNNPLNLMILIITMSLTFFLIIFPLEFITLSLISFCIITIILKNKFGTIFILISLDVILKIINIFFPSSLNFYFFPLFIIGYIVLFFNNIVHNIEIKFSFDFFSKLILIFFFYLIFSTLIISSDKSYGMVKLLYMLTNISFIFIILNLIHKIDDIEIFFQAVYLLSIVVIIYAALSYIGLISYNTLQAHGRFSMLDMNPIRIARYASFGLIASIYFLMKNHYSLHYKTMKFILCLAIMFFQLYLIFITGSRGPFIGTILFILILSFSLFKINLKTLLFIIIFYILISFVFRSIIPEQIFSRLFTSDKTSINSSLIRLLANIHALKLFISSPILGIGFGSFQFGGGFIPVLIYPHNVFTELLSETGFLGFSLFSTIVIFCTHSLKLLKKKLQFPEFYAIFGLFLLTFINANLSSNTGNSVFLWYSIGLIYAVRKIGS